MRNAKLLTLLFILLIATSCGGAEVSPPAAVFTPEPAYAAPASIPADDTGAGTETPVVSVGMDGFTSADDAVADVIFNKLGVKLIPVNVREDDYVTLSSMAASGALPDLLRVNIASSFFTGLAEEGLLREWQPEYESLTEIMAASDSLAAVRYLYGGQAWFMPLKDVSSTDPGRIYYRKDWLMETELPVPDTADGFAVMLQALSESKNRPGLTLAGGVTYLVALFGADPYGWIDEGGIWIPAYYSEQMLPGLQYARRLYENGWLDFEYAINKANTAVNKFAADNAGSLIRHGDGLWMRRVLSDFSKAHGISVQEAYDNYVGVLPPVKTAVLVETAIPVVTDAGDATVTEEPPEPALVEQPPHWPRRIPGAGLIMPVTASDEAAQNAQALLDFILTDESVEMARYGIRGETAATDANGRLRLFVDPATAQPFDIIGKYPAARVLFLMGEPFSAPLPARAQAALKRTDGMYAAAVPDMDNGYLAHFIRTPARARFESAVDISAEFNKMVMGGAPVDEMFAAFKASCDENGIGRVIEEVNERIE